MPVMYRPGLVLLLTLTLAACKTEPGDEGTGTDATTGTTAETTATGTTSTGATTGGASATTSTTGAPTTGDGTTGTTGVDETRCSMYCQDIMANCTGPVAQYPSLDSCLNICATFRPGDPDDVSGNSFACRVYHTGAAATDAATHCVHAGPSGGGACGDNCQGFCSIATAICPAEHPDPDACLTECMGFPDTEPFDTGDAGGNTLACRLYHLTVAATDDASAATHCPHTVTASPPCM